VLFIKFIIFGHYFFNCIKKNFLLDPLTFDFYIKFILLFYDVSGLTLSVLIPNLDSWLFYRILISFQFHHLFHDFFLNFFIFGPRFLDFFLFWILLRILFFFQFFHSIQYLMIFNVRLSLFL